MKNAPTTIMNRFLRLTLVCVACVVVVGHGHLRDAEAQSRWDRTGDSREGLFVTFRDIFHGGADRPDSATSSVSSSGRGDRLLRNIGKGISERARQVSGAVSQVSEMKQRVRGFTQGSGQGFAAVAQRLGGRPGNGIFSQVGNGRGGEGLRNIAGVLQSGTQVAGGLRQIRSALGGGGGELQKIRGVAGGVSRIGDVAGRFGGGNRNGPFGQFLGQNNQLMQGMGRFLGLLQQILGLFGGGGSPFNPSNTGRSAGMAFANLMGANSGGANGSPTGGFINPSGIAQDAISFCDARQMFGEQAKQAGLVGRIPDDINDYWDASRHGKFEGTKDQWATVMMAVASEESTFGSNGISTKESFPEFDGTLSQGVFSMTAGEYGLTSSSVFDPLANSRAAALTMNRLLGSNNTIAGLGRYWGPVYRGEVNNNTVTSAAGLGNIC